ncbi:predicted protein [Histoplasma capsulatum var. duboisii H88]|uniref:Predicted protein n=1 Tax=Ajellomyces capsulatus (strain H88) TaxID=544711 RepID=F0U7P9_AJEC8|nr:predicted protein [Histoplasma capsulatum var. duboisii H88]
MANSLLANKLKVARCDEKFLSLVDSFASASSLLTLPIPQDSPHGTKHPTRLDCDHIKVNPKTNQSDARQPPQVAAVNIPWSLALPRTNSAHPLIPRGCFSLDPIYSTHFKTLDGVKTAHPAITTPRSQYMNNTFISLIFKLACGIYLVRIPGLISPASAVNGASVHCIDESMEANPVNPRADEAEDSYIM